MATWWYRRVANQEFPDDMPISRMIRDFAVRKADSAEPVTAPSPPPPAPAVERVGGTEGAGIERPLGGVDPAPAPIRCPQGTLFR